MGGAALGACLLAAVSFAPESRAATLWMGATTNFTQSLSQPVDVLIPGAVSLTRAGSRWLYNPGRRRFGSAHRLAFGHDLGVRLTRELSDADVPHL